MQVHRLGNNNSREPKFYCHISLQEHDLNAVLYDLSVILHLTIYPSRKSMDLESILQMIPSYKCKNICHVTSKEHLDGPRCRHKL